MSVEVPLMTKSVFQEKSGISDSLLRKLIETGVIPTVSFGDRSTLINNAMLDDLCTTGQIEPGLFSSSNQLTRIK